MYRALVWFGLGPANACARSLYSVALVRLSVPIGGRLFVGGARQFSFYWGCPVLSASLSVLSTTVKHAPAYITNARRSHVLAL